jgi:hypothetical protein
MVFSVYFETGWAVVTGIKIVMQQIIGGTIRMPCKMFTLPGGFISFTIEGLCKCFRHRPFADPFHAAKKICVGNSVPLRGFLQDTDLLFMAINLFERHRLFPYK